MIKKSIVALSCAIALSSASISAQVDTLKDMYKNDPWKLMEYEFVIKPEKQAKLTLSKLAKITATGIGLAPGLLMGISRIKNIKNLKNLISNIKNNDNNNIEEVAKTAMLYIVTLATLVGGPILAYNFVKYLIEKQFAFFTLRNFVVNWKKGNVAVPEVFHDTFEELHQNFVQAGKGKSAWKLWWKTTEMHDKIRRLVYNKYHEKYALKLKSGYEEKVLPKFLHSKQGKFLMISGGITMLAIIPAITLYGTGKLLDGISKIKEA